MRPGRRGWALAGLAAGLLCGLALLAGPAVRAAIPILKDWTEPQAPFRIAGSLYYVGSRDLASYLIVTREGLIVIDGGLDQNAPQILDNIRALGFDPRRIRILLNSHAHLDHAGGLAALKAASGAKLYASRRDKPFLESGGAHDPALGDEARFPPVKVDHVLGDGEKVTLGGVTLTALLTPGHTPGCTTWSMPLEVDGRRRQALFICSVSVLPTVRLAGPHPTWPGIAADFTRTFKVLKARPCDIFLGAHASFYDMLDKRAAMKPGAPNPFVDPTGCRAYLERGQATFEKRLARDRAG